MTSHKVCLTAGLVYILLLMVTADNSVHILSKYGQLVTSSTLNWLTPIHYEPSKNIVIGGFEVTQIIEEDPSNNQADKPRLKEKRIFVCRALHNGIWVAGRQKEGEQRCVVSFLGNVHSYERYELLENVDSAARISWVYWDKYHKIPVGAIAADTMYVARHKVHDDQKDSINITLGYTHYIGIFSAEDKFGTIIYVKDDGVEGSSKSGEILVETEPIYYELTSVKLNYYKKRIIKRVPQILGEATLSNTDSKLTKVADAFGYWYNYSMYWGQGHAILKGLNTSITLVNKTRLPDIVWSIEEKENRTNVYTVEILLEPGTAVNVTLKANYIDMEVPYSGNLVSHYEDKAISSREINGIRREENMIDIRPEFGPIYFLNNFSLVPTTIPPPTTEPITTNVPLRTSKKPHRIEDEHLNFDENMIISPKKTDMNMQSDDGGPLSLKNKVEGTQSGAFITEPTSLVIIFLLIVTFNRIT